MAELPFALFSLPNLPFNVGFGWVFKILYSGQRTNYSRQGMNVGIRYADSHLKCFKPGLSHWTYDRIGQCPAAVEKRHGIAGSVHGLCVTSYAPSVTNYALCVMTYALCVTSYVLCVTSYVQCETFQTRVFY